MRKLASLILDARERTKNLDVEIDSTTGRVKQGISDDVFIRYFNNAKDHLQSAILNLNPDSFVEFEEKNLQTGVEEYTISGNVFANGKIINVECSYDGETRNYFKLEKKLYLDRDTSEGYPEFYIRRANKLLVNPIPKTSIGKLRISYYKAIDNADIKRAQVNGTPSGATITIDTPSALESLKLSQAELLCICKNDGTPLLYNGRIASFSSPTITLEANVSTYLLDGVTLADLDNQNITLLPYSTTHYTLPDFCERYLVTYCQKRILTTDESNTSIEEDSELLKIEQDILQAYAEEDRDIYFVPVIDKELML